MCLEAALINRSDHIYWLMVLSEKGEAQQQSMLWVYEGRLRAGVVKPRGNEAPRRCGQHFPVPKGATRELERDFTRTCSDGTRDNGLQLEEGRFRSDL